MNTALIVSYFEHVIPGLGWGPEDKHIKPWIDGTDSWRQNILLRIATWQKLNEGRLREIVEALTRSKDKKIAELAKGVLAGRISYSDL